MADSGIEKNSGEAEPWRLKLSCWTPPVIACPGTKTLAWKGLKHGVIDTRTYHTIQPPCRIPKRKLKAAGVDAWLRQDDPPEIDQSQVNGKLRILCQLNSVSESEMGIYPETWDMIADEFGIHSSYVLDRASQKEVPVRVFNYTSPRGPRLNIICQSPLLRDSFTSLAVSYDYSTSATNAFLSGDGRRNSPGRWLLDLIKNTPSLSSNLVDPMLLPTLLFVWWVDQLQTSEHQYIANQLRFFQSDTNLFTDYLKQRAGRGEGEKDRNDQHRRIVEAHSYLTNGVALFVQTLGNGLTDGLKKVEELCSASHSRILINYDSGEISRVIEHANVRVEVEMRHRQRMLDRIEIYFPILYTLMQQDIARDTKKDSSDMKSITILTMVFLPATAIATVISPFLTIDSTTNHIRVVPQFWIFWAITVPATVLVLLVWLIWTQRSEIRSALTGRRDGYRGEKGP